MADSFLPPVVAVLTASISDFSAKMGEAKGEMAAVEESAGKMGVLGKTALLGVAAAAGAVGYESVKMATDFQTQMTRLYTAAGAPKQAVMDASNTILQLATSVGQTGTAMAEALYHPISAGLDMATSLQVVKYAAEEAAISGASLDDTTYSLSSVMKAFNMSAGDAGNVMADLNAIVGEGDMRFQDFNESVKNWAPTAAQMGISINSMGAGLAYLTDRGNSAEVASTRLTMGISMMTTPSGQAAKMLEGLGVASSDVSSSSAAMESAMKKANITQNQLANDLKQPDGLYVALNHLKTALEQAGVSGTEADSVLSKIFGGGRSDKAIMSLMQNLDGLKDKYQAIANDSSPQKFAQNWADAQKTFGFQMKQLGAFFSNLAIEIGTKLLPILSKMAQWFLDSVKWLGQHKDVLMAIASLAIPFLIAGVGKLVTSVVEGFAKMAAVFVSNPWALLIAAVVFLVYEIISHWNQIKTFLAPFANWLNQHVIQPVVRFFQQWWKSIQPHVTALVNGIRDAWNKVVGWTKDHWALIKAIIDKFIETVKPLVKAWLDEFINNIKFAWAIVTDVFKTAFNIIRDVFNMIIDEAKDFINFFKGVIDFFKGVFTGNWREAWNGIKEMVSSAVDGIKTIVQGIVNIGRDLVTGLWNGIKAAGGWLLDQIKNWANGILDSIKSFFGISSPSKETALHGRFLVEGLAKGILDNTHLATGAAAAMVSRVLGVTSGMGTSFDVSATGSALASGVGAAVGGAQSTQINITMNPRDLQMLFQQGALRYNLRNTSNGLAVGVA